MVSATISATPKTTRPVINSDIMDRFTDNPLPRDEAAQVLAFYFPFVEAWSQTEAWKNQYLQARIHVGCAIGRHLGPQMFMSATEIGSEIYARRTGRDTDVTYEDWTMDQLFEELSTDIDQLLDGAK